MPNHCKFCKQRIELDGRGWISSRTPRSYSCPVGGQHAPVEPRFVNVGKTVMQGQNHIAEAVSSTMAKRIARALDCYMPGPKGY